MADVRGILAARSEDLDVAYIERWAAELGILERWRLVVRQVAEDPTL